MTTLDEDELPEGFTTIEAIIDELERDPVMVEHLRKARIKLAPILYGENGVQPDQERYERMMRGEGPLK